MRALEFSDPPSLKRKTSAQSPLNEHGLMLVAGEDETYVCEEEGECGKMIRAVEKSETTVGNSGIAGAGLGLFAAVPLSHGDIVGYFGGTQTCVLCVKKYKLNTGRNRFTTIMGDSKDNEWGEEVLWYIQRSLDEDIDGKLWFINSSSIKNKNVIHKHPNCMIESMGFDVDGSLLLAIKIFGSVYVGTELLFDYM